MSFFYIYETVDFPIRVTPKEALEDYEHIVVSLGQGSGKNEVLINKNESELGIDLEEGIINLHLSQEETSQFQVGKVLLQVNIYYEDTERDTSDQAKIEARDNLYKRYMD